MTPDLDTPLWVQLVGAVLSWAALAVLVVRERRAVVRRRRAARILALAHRQRQQQGKGRNDG